MTRNGDRRPPRPRIELVSPAASPQEAAAIAAAIEQFLAETSPTPAVPAESLGRWQRAALEDGTAARAGLPSRWGVPPADPA